MQHAISKQSYVCVTPKNTFEYNYKLSLTELYVSDYPSFVLRLK